MNAGDLIDALQLPASARVDQRIPKKLLVENGASTSADKRHITEGIEDIHWLAALKPGTVGIPEYRDETREYLEIAVLSGTLRAQAKAGRLAELVHRAVPYPMFLILADAAGLYLSLAHKRWAQNEAGKVVLEGEIVEVTLAQSLGTPHAQDFLAALALATQPRTHLLALYQGWMDAMLAFQVAGKTGLFILADSPAHTAARRQALRKYQELEVQMTALRTQANKEKQLARRVGMNLELQKLQHELDASIQTMTLCQPG
jgi:hypothetical protein